MNSLPHFPKFTTLTTTHKVDVDNFTKQFPPYSDFNFTSMFSWQGSSDTEIALLGNNLVIKLPDYQTGLPVISILGRSDIDNSIKTLLEHTPKLELVPEVIIEGIAESSAFIIIEDRDNFDYMYKTNDLIDMTGPDYKKIRNKLSGFRRDHADSTVEVKLTTQVSNAVIERIVEVNNKWSELRKNKHEARAETQALKKLMTNAFLLDVLIIELVVDGEIKGFSINEILANGNAICHFEKTLKTHHVNTGHFLVYETAKLLKRAGIHTVNWEQDLGIPGLRRAKESYNPCGYLKKFTVTLAD